MRIVLSLQVLMVAGTLLLTSACASTNSAESERSQGLSRQGVQIQTTIRMLAGSTPIRRDDPAIVAAARSAKDVQINSLSEGAYQVLGATTGMKQGAAGTWACVIPDTELTDVLALMSSRWGVQTVALPSVVSLPGKTAQISVGESGQDSSVWRALVRAWDRPESVELTFEGDAAYAVRAERLDVPADSALLIVISGPKGTQVHAVRPRVVREVAAVVPAAR